MHEGIGIYLENWQNNQGWTNSCVLAATLVPES